ncbi:MAG: glycosyltransferase family 4 protein, partial [Thermoleophilia bacterium]|nr:glycosyltransferase family 4 protein [Thermoleophilia bacterium]
ALGLGDRPAALLVAHDFRLKGVPAAVRAVADLHRADPSGAPILVVVGRDPQRPVTHLAARLGVAHLVRLEGARDELLLYYHAADVLVHPTFYDPCSLVALEAVACGLPVVTSRFNGAAELLEGDAGCAVVDDPGDHRALSLAMAQALQPATNRRMREGALRRRPLLDGAAGQVALEGLYRSVIASRRRGGPEERPGPGVHGGLPAGPGASRAAAR